MRCCRPVTGGKLYCRECLYGPDWDYEVEEDHELGDRSGGNPAETEVEESPTQDEGEPSDGEPGAEEEGTEVLEECPEDPGAASPERRCGTCGGSGKLTPGRLLGDGTQPPDVPCPTCQG